MPVNGVTKDVSLWWIRGVTALAGALKAEPCGAMVLQADLADAIVVDAVKRCSMCCQSAVKDVRAFAELYARQVEDAVSVVSTSYIPRLQLF